MTFEERKQFNRLRRIIAYLCLAILLMANWISNLRDDKADEKYEKEVLTTSLIEKDKQIKKLYEIIDTVTKIVNRKEDIKIETPVKQKKISKKDTLQKIINLPKKDTVSKVDTVTLEKDTL